MGCQCQRRNSDRRRYGRYGGLRAPTRHVSSDHGQWNTAPRRSRRLLARHRGFSSNIVVDRTKGFRGSVVAGFESERSLYDNRRDWRWHFGSGVRVEAVRTEGTDPMRGQPRKIGDHAAALLQRHDYTCEVPIGLPQDLQARHGGVTARQIGDIARSLGLPAGQPRGTATFYSMLQVTLEPSGLAPVCDGVACLLQGTDTVHAHLAYKTTRSKEPRKAPQRSTCSVMHSPRRHPAGARSARWSVS
jgi:hypothetical protein